jgi:ADP-ribosylglycohydrolase
MSILGAIAGDMIGSRFEHDPTKSLQFELFSAGSRFTDDTVLTLAIASALLGDQDYGRALESFYYRYPTLPYGARFHDWARGLTHEPYNSWGNGSAMRVSPVAYASQDVEWVLAEAKRSAEVTHSHPEGIRGAQAVALSILLARLGAAKADIKREVEERFHYNLSRTVWEVRPGYVCYLSCQHTVPEAIICFLDSDDFEGAVRNAVSLGGDADTMACITGSISAPFYGGLPLPIQREVTRRLDEYMLEVCQAFATRFEGVEAFAAANLPRRSASDQTLGTIGD